MRTSCIFCDLDGCLIEHCGGDLATNPNPKLLPGAKDLILKCHKEDIRLIITTGRKESDRELTVKQLQKLNINYDMIIFGVGSGKRILINDKKPNNNENTAIAINLDRNKGINNINFF